MQLHYTNIVQKKVNCSWEQGEIETLLVSSLSIDMRPLGKSPPSVLPLASSRRKPNSLHFLLLFCCLMIGCCFILRLLCVLSWLLSIAVIDAAAATSWFHWKSCERHRGHYGESSECCHLSVCSSNNNKTFKTFSKGLTIVWKSMVLL